MTDCITLPSSRSTKFSCFPAHLPNCPVQQPPADSPSLSHSKEGATPASVPFPKLDKELFLSFESKRDLTTRGTARFFEGAQLQLCRERSVP
jgi:hypothetical protein